LLNKKISVISKFLLLFSLLGAQAFAQNGPKVIFSDRFLIKILDQTVSLQDFNYQLRNLEALQCVYEDALVIKYFGATFLGDFKVFLEKFPQTDEQVRIYLHKEAELLKKIRYLFKLLRYSEDQKELVSPKLTELIREGTKENRCAPEILHKQSLKTNFLHLMQVELYLRSRYGNQLKESGQKFDSIRPSIDLFVDSLDKQFIHEYFW